ncbi:hypothetical protein TNCV_3924681 [Trichonephila clavipes]|nr:hypothetical protein TNCV_3924681 [Trichonephila clavipes]
MDHTTTSQARRMGTVCNINSVCTNSSMTCAAAWTFNSETMAAATLDAASHTGASLMYQDGRIRVRGLRGKGTLAARIRHRHIGPTPGIMVWIAIGCMCWTATAGSVVVQSGRPIFDDFFQHLWPYIGNRTANVVFQMVKHLWLIRLDQ